eukprot:TRINITY_DN9786_c0_g1_i2.p1 TRINITY_DN9786_c0_g1~~TRINITY_DN9786_c0_g1_i2.p1  ORF type:complete len:136 (-),score=15.88 TRINITY_DN9786_c0_g1_i2:355-762(-)
MHRLFVNSVNQHPPSLCAAHCHLLLAKPPPMNECPFCLALRAAFFSFFFIFLSSLRRFFSKAFSGFCRLLFRPLRCLLSVLSLLSLSTTVRFPLLTEDTIRKLPPLPSSLLRLLSGLRSQLLADLLFRTNPDDDG